MKSDIKAILLLNCRQMWDSTYVLAIYDKLVVNPKQLFFGGEILLEIDLNKSKRNDMSQKINGVLAHFEEER